MGSRRSGKIGFELSDGSASCCRGVLRDNWLYLFQCGVADSSPMCIRRQNLWAVECPSLCRGSACQWDNDDMCVAGAY
nr:hypothetical protein CFP56_00371 [Quercus suber]